MKKNLHDIDKIFKDALDEHLEPAPSAAWDAVSNDLDKRQAFHFKEKYFRLKRLAVALLLIVFAGIVYMLYVVKHKTNDTGLAQKEIKVTQQQDAAAKAKPVQNEAVKSNLSTGKSTAKPAAVPALPKGTKLMPGAAEQSTVVKENTVASNNPVKNNRVTNEVKQINEDPINTTATGAAHINKNAVATGKNPQKQPAAGNPLSGTDAPESTDRIAAVKKEDKILKLHARNLRQHLTIAGAATLSGASTGSAKDQVVKNKSKTPKSGSQSLNKILRSKENPLADDVRDQQADVNSNNEKKQLAAIPAKRAISPLAAYLYPAPLVLSSVDFATPGSVTGIGTSSFLNTLKNDQLQNPATQRKPAFKSSFSMMPFVSLNHSFTTLENDDLRARPGSDKKVAERDEKQSTSYTAGILVNYSISRSLLLQSGLVFTSAKTIISPKMIYARPDNNGHTRYEFNCASGYAYINPKTGTQPAVGDSILVTGSSSTLTYIGVPLSINYVWQRGRFLLKPGIGISVNFLTSGKSVTALANAGDQKEISAIAGLKSAYADASIGFGTELMLNRKISIGFRPLLRMALTSINKDTPVKTYQNFLSFETGVKINL